MVVNIFLDLLDQLSGQFKGLLVKNDQDHSHLMVQKELLDHLQRNLQCHALRETVGSAGHQRKGNTLAGQFCCQCQCAFITGPQRLFLSMLSIDPCRTDRMEDVFCVQLEGRRVFRMTRLDQTNLFTFRKQIVPSSCLIDGGIGAVSNNREWICSIDDRIRLNFRYIISNNLEWHINLICLVIHNVKRVDRNLLETPL